MCDYTKTANDLKTNLFRKLEKYKEIINNEIENLYILNNEKKEKYGIHRIRGRGIQLS